MKTLVRTFLDPMGMLWAKQELIPGATRTMPRPYSPEHDWQLESETTTEVVYRASRRDGPRRHASLNAGGSAARS